jgi:hypothetical protein
MRYWLLIGAVILGMAGYLLLYRNVTAGFVAGLDTWLEARRAEGAEASYGGLTHEGFPFRIVVRLDSPRLALPEVPPRPLWQASRLALVLQPWDLRHLIFDLSGQGRLEADDGARRRRLDYDVAEGLASYQTDTAGRLLRLSVDLRQVALDEPGGAAATLARGQLHVRPGESGAIETALQLDNLHLDTDRLPEALRPLPAFGPEVALLQVDASIEGAPPLAGDPRSWLARWRDQGGDLQLRRLKLTWGEVDIESTGTLALDAEMRPLGALTAKVKGHEHLIDAAVAAGQMRRKDAQIAKAVLGTLASAAGGVLSVPITLQDGVASLGPVPIARLQPLFSPVARNQAPPSPAPPQ